MTQRYIQTIEDQHTSISIHGKSFAFHFFAFRDLMYVDIEYDGEAVVSGKRVMANQWLIPSYVASGIGNIRFETYAADGDDYVWYEGFNTKFRLVTYTADEIAELEAEEEEAE